MYFCRAARFSVVFILTVLAPTIAVAATHTVLVGTAGNNFDPPNVTVAPGDTIEWVHVSGSHTVTSGSSCTPDGRFNQTLPLGGNVTYIVPMAEPDGVIPYFCIPHCAFGMTGTITVQGPVPTVSEWGILAMLLAMLVVGTIAIRKARPLFQ